MFLIALLTGSHAATLTVGPGCTYSSIGLAISSASDGDTIGIRAGTYPESGLYVDKNLLFYPVNASCVLDSAAGPVLIDGNGDQIMHIDGFAGGNASIVGIDFTDGYTPFTGGLIEADGGADLMLYDCLLTDGWAENGGGAVYAASGLLNISGGTRFADNAATTPDGHGGAVFCDHCSLTVHESDFSGNTAQAFGGAIYLFDVSSASFSTDERITFRSNTAGRAGGAIGSYRTLYDVPTVSISTTGDGLVNFIYNESDEDGGAVWIDHNTTDGPSLTLDGEVAFSYNVAAEDGGALASEEAVVQIGGDVSFHYNDAARGGAIYAHTQDRVTGLTVSGASFLANEATDGGAIYTSGLSVDVSRTQLQYNTAEDQGGALYLDGGLHFLEDVKLLDNTAAEGGGLYLYGSEARMDVSSGCGGLFYSPTSYCSEVRDNTGGGIVLGWLSIVQVQRTLFEGNEGDLNEGIASAIHADGSIIEVFNSLFFENSMTIDVPAVTAMNTSLSQIHSSTFANNGFRAAAWYDDSDGQFDQSIDQLQGAPMIVDALAEVYATCSNFDPIIGTFASSVKNQDNATGLFVNQAADNYRLAAGSPSLNVCDPATNWDVRPDIRNNPTVGWLDQGAFERQ
jgi:predicted outer membrane repeat protein